MNHGTYAGYRRHRRRDEEPCRACMKAARDASRKRRAEAGELGALRERLGRRAARRANAVLRDRHPIDYLIVYDLALADLYTEAGLDPATRP